MNRDKIELEVHDILNNANLDEKSLNAVLSARYAEIPRDPDIGGLDITYIELCKALQYGAAAAVSGVIGNAVYDAAKSAVAHFVRRRRANGHTSLTSEEAEAFALYALAIAGKNACTRSVARWDGTPPRAIGAEKEQDYYVVRFAETVRCRIDGFNGSEHCTVEITFHSQAPDIANTQWREVVQRRLDEIQVHSHVRWWRERVESRWEAAKQSFEQDRVTEWRAVIAPKPPEPIPGGVCGI